MKKEGLRFLSHLNFSGLTADDRENRIMEPFFLLSHYGGISWDVYYNWPIVYKDWYLKRLKRELETEGGAQDAAASTPSKKIAFSQLKKAFAG